MNGFGCYAKGGKVGCEKDRISIVLSFSSDDMVIGTSGGLILIINDEK